MGRHKKVIQFSILESAAANCRTRTEFNKLDDKLYRQAVRTGEIDILFPNTKKNEVWTNEKVFLAANLSKNLTELNEVYRGAYDFATKNNLLNKLQFTKKNKLKFAH